MKTTLHEGLCLTRHLSVDAARTITFLGDSLRVYATYQIISDIEYACRDLLLAHVDPGWDSVGTAVGLSHVAATPLGARVNITVRVAEIEGARVRFDAEVRDTAEVVARGTHERFCLPVASLDKRLKAKVARLAS